MYLIFFQTYILKVFVTIQEVNPLSMNIIINNLDSIAIK